MSYIVFARKWRPQNFDDVIDQDHVVKTLKNAITSNRLAHAYIFAGPRGVGKTSTARILAKSLNCRQGPTLSPCNTCTACIEITQARSFDVIEIDGASNRGIDDIRALRENVKFAATHGKFKVYIIDEVHQITSEGFNALLKTLEEPPPHVKFIFATTHPQKIPSTILSRCQLLEFRRISNVRIIEQLRKIALSEKLSLKDDVLLAIAKNSDGSLRDAESTLDELVSFSNGDIKLKDVHSIMGVVEQEYLFEIVDKIIKKDAVGLLQLLDKLIDEGKDLTQLLLNLIEYYRNVMIVKVTTQNHEKLLDLPVEACEVIARQAQGISLDQVLLGVNALLNAQEMARRIENLRIPLEIAFVKLSAQPKSFEQAVEVPAKKDEPQSLPAKEINPAVSLKPAASLNQPPASSSHLPAGQPPQKQAAATVKQQETHLDLEKIKALWPQFIEKVNKVKVSAGHYLDGGSAFKTQGSVLTIGFPRQASFNKESLERKENHLLLESVWKELLSQDIRIQFTFTHDPAPEKHIDNAEDPLLKSALDTFNGRVIRKG